MDQRQETLQRGRRWGRIAPPSYPAAFPLYRAVSRRQKAWIAAASDRKWEIVLRSGRKWGTVAPATTTGVAGLLPLRHFGPNSAREANWHFGATSNTRWTRRT